MNHAIHFFASAAAMSRLLICEINLIRYEKIVSKHAKLIFSLFPPNFWAKKASCHEMLQKF